MHQQLRASEQPLELNTASRSGQRAGVRGATVSFIGIVGLASWNALAAEGLSRLEWGGDVGHRHSFLYIQ